MEVKVISHKEEVLNELDKLTQKALFAMGLLGVEGCVEKASEIDSVTGRPTVDTERYRAGFGFITPTQGKMSGTPAKEKEAGDLENQGFSKTTIQKNVYPAVSFSVIVFKKTSFFIR